MSLNILIYTYIGTLQPPGVVIASSFTKTHQKKILIKYSYQRNIKSETTTTNYTNYIHTRWITGKEGRRHIIIVDRIKHLSIELVLSFLFPFYISKMTMTTMTTMKEDNSNWNLLNTNRTQTNLKFWGLWTKNNY